MPGGNGFNENELKELESFIHSPDSTDKAFKNQEGLNALRLMVLSDPEFLDNAMRYDLPSSRLILAIAFSMQRCKKHGYTGGIEFYKMICALLPAKRGKRIDQLVDAIAGERKWKEGMNSNNGLGDKIKNFVSGNK
jgi:hypothetical protein